MQYFVGMMSGTSLDGVDAVLVGKNNASWQVKAHANVAFTTDLKARLFSLNFPQENEIEKACQAEYELTTCYAAAYHQLLAQTTISPDDITAIGAHGQTIRHAPDSACPYTLQLLDGAKLSYLTNQTVVCDFRRKDIAAGGQGAPLAPYFHHEIFTQLPRPSAVVNIGGISNISVLSDVIIGFDCGPGNCLLDEWIAKHQGLPFDEGGQWAKKGKILPDLLSRCMTEDYFHRASPKSTGRDYFNLAWLNKYLQANEPPVDVMRTLVSLTAKSIAMALPKGINQLLLSGGGAKNRFLTEEIKMYLRQRNSETEVITSDAFGIDVQHLEAMGFAILAQKTLAKEKIDTKHFTGASAPIVLGAVYY